MTPPLNPSVSDVGLISTDAAYCPSHKCAISWQAILAGGVTAAVVSLALLTFGSGLGLAVMSPFSGETTSAVAFTAKVAIWMVIMQWAASAFGGYIAGRLRTRWVNTHHDEVYFRDTAHGFLAWAVATLFTAAFLATSIASVVSGGTQAAATVAAGAAASTEKANGPNDTIGYYVDSLLRPTTPSTSEAPRGEVNAEVARIFIRDLANDTFPDSDRAYLTNVVASRTNLSGAEATQRVDSAIAEAQADKQKLKDAADKARKVAAHLAIYTFLSMLVGAFIASVSAVLGGRCRDRVYVA